MVDVTCERCGTEFDTERDHAAGDNANSERCPSCGQEANVPTPDGGSNGDGTDLTIPAPEGAVVRITIEIVPGGDQ